MNMGYDQGLVTMRLTPRQLLVLGAVLRTMDEGKMQDEGIYSPDAEMIVDSMFENIDEALVSLLGEDWPVHIVHPEQLAEEMDY